MNLASVHQVEDRLHQAGMHAPCQCCCAHWKRMGWAWGLSRMQAIVLVLRTACLCNGDLGWQES